MFSWNSKRPLKSLWRTWTPLSFGGCRQINAYSITVLCRVHIHHKFINLKHFGMSRIICTPWFGCNYYYLFTFFNEKKSICWPIAAGLNEVIVLYFHYRQFSVFNFAFPTLWYIKLTSYSCHWVNAIPVCLPVPKSRTPVQIYGHRYWHNINWYYFRNWWTLNFRYSMLGFAIRFHTFYALQWLLFKFLF